MARLIQKDTVQRSLSAHAAIGLLTSALLYLVCVTGTVCVFYEELQRVEQPSAPEMDGIAPKAVQHAVEAVLASEQGQPRTTHLYVHLPVAALPRTTVTTDHQAVHVDSSGKIAVPEQNAWSEFVLELHYALNLPATIGLTVVGALGAAMLALSVTGVLAHPRIFRDAFRLRARQKGGVGLADWHNRLGVWTLPFALAIALTGAMIGLGSVGGLALAQAFYDGDIEAAYAPIFGKEGEPDLRAAALPDVAAALRQMSTRFPQAKPYYVVLHDPLTAGQQIQVIAAHPRRLIYGENYNFGAHGRFLGKTGLSDGAIGQQLAASTYNLHFGNYGGLPVKLAYALLGGALCLVIATGTSIWLGKRERRGLDHPRLRSGWDAVVWGVPLALTISLEARLLIGDDVALAALFWCLLAALVAASAALRHRLRWGRLLAKACAAMLAINFTSALLIAVAGAPFGS